MSQREQKQSAEPHYREMLAFQTLFCAIVWCCVCELGSEINSDSARPIFSCFVYVLFCCFFYSVGPCARHDGNAHFGRALEFRSSTCQQNAVTASVLVHCTNIAARRKRLHFCTRFACITFGRGRKRAEEHHKKKSAYTHTHIFGATRLNYLSTG